MDDDFFRVSKIMMFFVHQLEDRIHFFCFCFGIELKELMHIHIHVDYIPALYNHCKVNCQRQ